MSRLELIALTILFVRETEVRGIPHLVAFLQPYMESRKRYNALCTEKTGQFLKCELCIIKFFIYILKMFKVT